MSKNRQNDYLGSLSPETRDVVYHGIKGMKWGVRKKDPPKKIEMVGLGGSEAASITRKTKNGHEITLSRTPPSRFEAWIGSKSSRYADEFNNAAFFEIKDSSGRKIGDAVVLKRSDKELYLNWLGINKPERGQGYATSVMETAVEWGKKNGFEKLTLEVPGNSPDARHIYEKLGFRVIAESKKDRVWGGLAEMEYRFPKNLKHDSLEPDYETFLELLGERIDSMSDAEMKHRGIKGMKWGVRKDDSSSSTKGPISAPKDEAPSARYDRLLTNVKKHGANSLSEEDMQFVIKRGEAIRKIEKLNEERPDWFSSIAQKALKKAGERRMNNLAEGYAKKYIDDVLV